MKKSILLLFAALLFPLVLSAQPVQKILGHYSGDSIASEGSATTTTSGTRSIAVILEPEELDIFQGGKIVAIRVGLAESATITRVFVMPITDNNKYGDRTEWTCEMTGTGWNTVQLETPYDINLEEGYKLLVGFYYQQTAGTKPLSFVKLGTPYDTYTYTKVGSAYKWKAANTIDQGNLSLQCVVEKDSYPDYKILAYGLQSRPYVRVGEPLPFSLDLNNRGIKQIDANGLGIDVLVDDNLVTTVTNDEPFVDGYCTVNASIPTEDLESGEHVLKVQVTSVDGQPLENPVSEEAEFVAYKYIYPRQKHLVEQLTSTYCTYCPLGNSMLSKLIAQRDDVIWVGIHGNLGTGIDPFRSDQADSIMVYLTGGSISYPSGAFDRCTGWEDDVNIVNGLGYYEQYHDMVASQLGDFFDYVSDAMPTFVEIKGDCSFNEETRMATVSIHGRVSRDFDAMMGEDAKLTVYVVEDSLYARQLNAGSWVNNYIHNGVFRMALGSVKGESLNRTDGTYKNNYRVQIPADWNWEKLRVVAFVSRPITNYVNGFTDMYVNNADVFTFKVSDGVDEIVTDPDAVPVEYYDIMGRRHDSMQPGINIVKMSDGSSRKVLVK